jgi:hypothetical protein
MKEVQSLCQIIRESIINSIDHTENSEILAKKIVDLKLPSVLKTYITYGQFKFYDKSYIGFYQPGFNFLQPEHVQSNVTIHRQLFEEGSSITSNFRSFEIV